MEWSRYADLYVQSKPEAR